MDLLNGLTFYDSSGQHLADGNNVVVVNYMRGGPKSARCTALVEWGKYKLIMKNHHWLRLQRRLTATMGRSPLSNEMVMLRRAQAVGFETAKLFAYGTRRRLGLIAQQVLLTFQIDGHQSLDSWLRTTDISGCSMAAQGLAKLLGQVRSVGLADRDFGAHNLLVSSNTNQPGNLVWVDLEAAYSAPPRNANATCCTIGAALANWWICTGEKQDRLIAVFDVIKQHVPQPNTGWGTATNHINRIIAKRVDRQVCRNRANRLPDPL